MLIKSRAPPACPEVSRNGIRATNKEDFVHHADRLSPPSNLLLERSLANRTLSLAHCAIETSSPHHIMSLTDNRILHNLYSGLATPDDHLPPSSLFRFKPPAHLTRLKSTTTPGSSAHGTICSTANTSETPTPMITPSKFSYFPMNMHIVNKKLESLSRTRNGQLPVLEHLLSEEGSRPLSLGTNRIIERRLLGSLMLRFPLF